MVRLSMQALVTLLPPPFYETVMEIWSILEEYFDCESDYVKPEPHFTWQYADSYRQGSLSVLESLSANITPFEVETDIVSSFSGDNEVFFVRILPSERLVETHRQIWNALQPYQKSPSLLYQPGNWIPHITLSQHGDTANHPTKFKEFLNTIDVQWKFTVDRMTMLGLSDQNLWEEVGEFRLGKRQ